MIRFLCWLTFAAASGCACLGGGGRLHPGAFVVFAQDRLLVDRLEAPAPVPVTVGSASPAGLIQSDAPDLAEVNAAGQVVGHRAGRTLLRTGTSGSTMVVEVWPFSAISLQPAALSLHAGSAAPVQVLADGRCCLQPSDVTWQTTDPGVAAAIDAEIRAGRAGQATVTAIRGPLRADLSVTVSP